MSISVPVDSTAKTVKLWQYYIAALTGIELDEAGIRHKQGDFAPMIYEKHCKQVLIDDKVNLHPGVNLQALLAESIKSMKPMNGERILRKLADGRVAVQTKLIPAWKKLVESNPTRTQLELLLLLRQFLWKEKEHERVSSKKRKSVDGEKADDDQADNNDEEEDDAANSSKKKKVNNNNNDAGSGDEDDGKGKSEKTFNMEWYPLEWIVFLRFGPPAGANMNNYICGRKSDATTSRDRNITSILGRDSILNEDIANNSNSNNNNNNSKDLTPSKGSNKKQKLNGDMNSKSVSTHDDSIEIENGSTPSSKNDKKAISNSVNLLSILKNSGNTNANTNTKSLATDIITGNTHGSNVSTSGNNTHHHHSGNHNYGGTYDVSLEARKVRAAELEFCLNRRRNKVSEFELLMKLSENAAEKRVHSEGLKKFLLTPIDYSL